MKERSGVLGMWLVAGVSFFLLPACGSEGKSSGAGGSGGAGNGAGGGSVSSTGGSPTSSSVGVGGATGEGGATGSGGMTGAGGGPSSDDPCKGSSDGKHCGTELGGLADHNSLYTCSGGVTQSAEPCPLGCENNACKAQMQADPCASAMNGNGAYCGGGLVGGDANALYNCQNGATANKQQCANGCQVNPPGVADECKASGDPCVNANAGNGLYCGGPLGGDANALYNCQGGVTSNKQQCPNGCTIAPPGQPDSCAPAGGDQCCLEHPPGVITQSYSACGAGGSHYGIDYGTPIGTAIYAGMSGTVVGSALGFPNCYNNGCSQSCWNSFNYVKIKADCGDPNSAGKDFFIYYLHIDSLPAGISNGVHVNQGQLLAYSGNSGCSSGPHIHIETASVDAGGSSSLNTCKSVNPASRYCP